MTNETITLMNKINNFIENDNLNEIKLFTPDDFEKINYYLTEEDSENHKALGPIHFAIRKKKPEIAIYLIKNTILDSYSRSGHFHGAPLHFCALANDVKSAESILMNPGSAIDIKADVAETPLFMASENGHAEMVELLIKYRANPNLPNEYGRMPLHVNDGKGDNHFRITKFLIDAGANIDSQDDESFVPLDWYITQGRNTDSIKLLLDKAGITTYMPFNHFKSIMELAIDNPSFAFHQAIEQLYDQLSDDKKELFDQHKLLLLVG